MAAAQRYWQHCQWWVSAGARARARVRVTQPHTAMPQTRWGHCQPRKVLEANFAREPFRGPCKRVWLRLATKGRAASATPDTQWVVPTNTLRCLPLDCANGPQWWPHVKARALH